MTDLPAGPDGMLLPGTSRPAPEACSASGAVRRRTVLYLSGFDPQGAGRYHALYRNEAEKQSRVTGKTIRVGERHKEGPLASAWSVEMPLAVHGCVRTKYLFLRWDDIVRAHWPRSRWRLWSLTVSTTARMVANGSMWRFLQTSWPAFLALALPALSLAASLALLVAGWLASAGWWPDSPGGALALGFGVSWLAWRLLTWMNTRTQSDWLMRSARVILMQARGELPELEERLQGFADLLLAELRSPEAPDEVLVVGHSSGAMLAISVVARVLQHPKTLPAEVQRLSLLTLGQCVPVLSYQPEAHGFRAELQCLRRRRDLQWLDVTAPPDGCCFALIDPTELSPPRRPDHVEAADAAGGAQGPKRISARFATMFSDAQYRQIRRDKYRCHFQYLMAAEKLAEHDYFAITAGPQRLMQRHEKQPSVRGFRTFQRFGSPLRGRPEDT